MKFFPRYELQCGECGYVTLSRVMGVGVVQVRCTNRGCEAHGKTWEVQLGTLEAKEIPDEPEST